MPTDEMNPRTSTMRSLERAMDLLQVLEQSRVPLKLTAIARESGLHLATTKRILEVLRRFGYVSHDGLGYTMGVASLLNAHAFLVSNSLCLVASPVLQELAATSGLTSSLSVRVGFSQVLLARIEGATRLRYQLPIGERMRLHLGGARILAAALDPVELTEMLESIGEIRLVTGQVLTHAEFVESLKVIRKEGHVIGFSQRELGAASIAVPIRGRDESVVGAMQLSGLAEDVDPPKMEWYVQELKRASAAVTRRLN